MSEDDWGEHTQPRMNAPLIAKHTEPELLAAIDHNDHDTRAVYADWLEENGDLERAEFVRLQDRLNLQQELEQTGLLQRCCTIAHRTDMAWRVLVARPEIMGCIDDDCPGDWGSIAPTGLGNVRYCTTCDSCVRYCANESEMRDAQRNRTPYVLDIIAPDDPRR